MITANRSLLGHVCEALLMKCGLEGFWTPNGPFALGGESRTTSPVALTASQRVMLEFVRTLWRGEGELKVSDLLDELDDHGLVALGTLFVGAAYGDRGVSDWLAIARGDVVGPQGDGEEPSGVH